jgi:hypothetical protein
MNKNGQRVSGLLCAMLMSACGGNSDIGIKPKSGSYPLNKGILLEGELIEASIIFAAT